MSWKQTYTGRQFDCLAPAPEAVSVEDIAHALALTCRFGGHSAEFYSVAEHSIRVAELVPPALRPCALLHDAAEAYLGDVGTPIKRHLLVEGADGLWRAFSRHETAVRDAIERALGLDPSGLGEEGRQAIKEADLSLLATERRDLMGHPELWGGWCALPEPLPKKIHPQPWRVAKLVYQTALELELERIKDAKSKEVAAAGAQ